MNCKNCGYSHSGNFCSHCGQNAKIERINLRSLLDELSQAIFQVDKGFFYTLRELLLRPGKSLREFLDGKRKKYFKPIAYMLTLSTLYFLVSQFTNQNIWTDDLASGFMAGATEDESAPAVLSWFSRNYAYTTLLLLPVFSFASYLSFSKYGDNYLEHIVINAYVTGQQAIFYAFFAFFNTFVECTFSEILPLLVAIGYVFWVFWQLFSADRAVTIVFRSILTYILYFIFSLLLLFVALGISGYR